jgi:hypothetical protein
MKNQNIMGLKKNYDKYFIITKIPDRINNLLITAGIS